MDQKTGRQITGWLLAIYGGFQLAVMLLVLAVIWLLFVGFGVIGAIGAMSDGEPGAAAGVVILAVGMALFYTLFFIPFVLYYATCLGSGVGLLRDRSWAVVVGSVVSALGMVLFPLGTAVGVGALLLLWVPQPSSGASTSGQIPVAPA